jgi:hypothetical protein
MNWAIAVFQIVMQQHQCNVKRTGFIGRELIFPLSNWSMLGKGLQQWAIEYLQMWTGAQAKHFGQIRHDYFGID